jgi:CHAT domain-containing protein
MDRLLGHLLPLPAGTFRQGRRGPVYGAVIGRDGRLRNIRHRWTRTWRDRHALSVALDRLVAAHLVRAVAFSELGLVRHSDGLVDEDEWAVHVQVEHEAGHSFDFFVPFDWSPVRPPHAREPTWIDRVLTERPHRRGPGSDDEARVDIWQAPPAAEAAELYWTDGDYDELQRAIEIADHAVRRLTKAQPAWPAAADELAVLLAARFQHAGDAEDIFRAIDLGRAAVKILPEQGEYRENLARYLGLRFAYSGALSDLEEAVEEARSVYNAAENLMRGVEATETFVDLLLMRYRATAEERWLSEAGHAAIDTLNQARPHEDVSTTQLFKQIGTVSLIMFELNGDREHLERAVKYSGIALDATEESDPFFGKYLFDHALALLRSYEVIGDARQLAHAHNCFGKAEERMHATAPERPSVLLGLAATKLHPLLFDQLSASLHEMVAKERGAANPTAEWASLTIAIDKIDEALSALPDGSAERLDAHAMLASGHLKRFKLAGAVDDLRAAVDAAERGANDWAGWFVAVPVPQKLGSSRRGAAVHAVGVEALLDLAAREPGVAVDARRRAFVLAEAAKSRVLTEQLSHADLPVPPDVSRRLAKRERSLLAALAALDTATLAARDTAVGSAIHSRRRAVLLDQLGGVWAAIAARGERAAEYVAMRRGGALSWAQIAELAARHGPRTAVVSVFVLESRTVLFTARAGAQAPTVVEVDLSEQAWTQILRRFDRELPRSRGLDELPQTWQTLLRPLVGALADEVHGCERIIVVPHRGAHGLPWMLLAHDWMGADGRPPVVSTVPALALLDRLQRRPPTRGRATVVVGNPTGDLAHAEDEARAVGQALGIEPLIGSRATRDVLTSAVSNAKAIHLASHARFDPAVPLDAYVALADGPWHAREALASRMDADLVLLSGCETGRAEPLAGDELAGLVQAFLHAGARALVVSRWPVDDASTADLMRAFHEYRLAGADVASALTAAADSVRRIRSHPWYWAAFEVVGDVR